MNILVCKFANSFVEPCCAQFIRQRWLESNLKASFEKRVKKKESAVFSSDVWAGYAFLKQYLRLDCDYKEIFSYDESNYFELFKEYSHVVFYTPFPRNLNDLNRINNLTSSAKNSGCKVAYISRDLGFAEQMIEDREIYIDVYISAFDTQEALKWLYTNGFFEEKAEEVPYKILDHKLIKANKITHTYAGFLDVKNDDLNKYDYWNHPKIGKQRAITAGSGCPHSCTYCAKRFTPWRIKDPGVLAQEVGYWKNTAIELFHNNLFQDKNWLSEFLDKLSYYPYKRTITTLGRIDDLYHCMDLFNLLSNNGIRKIHVGLESANQRVLQNMKKEKNDLDQLNSIINKSKKYGIFLQLNLLLGMPEEGEDSIAETFEVFKKYKSTTNITLLRPEPIAPVYKELVELGLINEDIGIRDFLKTWSNLRDSEPHVETKYLSKEQLRKWHNQFIGEKRKNIILSNKYINKFMSLRME